MKTATSSPNFWPRIGFIVLGAISLAPMIIHYRFVDYRLAVFRYPYPWGLMPVHFLALRWFADVSAWICIGQIAALIWSFARPSITRAVLWASVWAAACFFIAYASYALVIVAILLAYYQR